MTLMLCPNMVSVLVTARKDLKGEVPDSTIMKSDYFSSHGHGVAGKALWAELTVLNNSDCLNLLKGNAAQ